MASWSERAFEMSSPRSPSRFSHWRQGSSLCGVPSPSVNEPNIRAIGAVQLVTFLVGIVLTVIARVTAV
jgi:hypothetical protein